MGMLGQVGNWDGHIGVGFGPEMLEWLDAYETGRYFKITWSVVETSGRLSRTLSLVPGEKSDPCTYKVCGRGPKVLYEQGTHVPYDMIPGLERLNLPRFELHETDFIVHQDGLRVLLGDDHVLPWPKLRKSCELYHSPELVEVELMKRMVSCLRAGQRGFIGAQRCPDRLTALLPPGAYRDVMDRARNAVGVMRPLDRAA